MGFCLNASTTSSNSKKNGNRKHWTDPPRGDPKLQDKTFYWIPIPLGSLGLGYLATWMGDFYGKWFGKYTIPPKFNIVHLKNYGLPKRISFSRTCFVFSWIMLDLRGCSQQQCCLPVFEQHFSKNTYMFFLVSPVTPGPPNGNLVEKLSLFILFFSRRLGFKREIRYIR